MTSRDEISRWTMQKEVDRVRCVYRDNCDESFSRSLKSNDLAHFANFYPRRSRKRPSDERRERTYIGARAGGADDDEYDDDDDEPFYRIRRRGGLFRWGGFRRISPLHQSACAKSLYGMREGR